MLTKENYLIPKTHPQFEGLMQIYEPMFNNITANNKGLSLKIEPDVIEAGQTMMFNEIILMAEHKKEWLEAILFAINLQIEQFKGGELYYSVEHFLTNEKIALWLRRLGETIPFTCFFLEDWEARFGTIAGDIIVNTKPDFVTEFDKARITTSVEDTKRIQQRIGRACTLFMHYCYGTGFDPKQAIEAILAEFQTPFDYLKVEQVFKEELEKKFVYRVSLDGDPPKE